MNLAELKRLVAKGESERVEFKRSTGTRNEATRTVCAMLNGMGGFVVFGVVGMIILTASLLVAGKILGKKMGQLFRA